MIQSDNKTGIEEGKATFELQVERVLQSEVFRTSDVLRRLLRFLADKAMSGEGDDLKEYTVATEGLGKPASYDTHQTTVRTQVGRLRHKLAEYYQTEGKEDVLILELPKGGFKLIGEPRPVVPIVPAGPEDPVRRVRQGSLVLVLGVALVLSLAWGSFINFRYLRAERTMATLQSMWTPEITQLWQPFLTNSRPIVLSIANPPFIAFKGFGVYHERATTRWDQIANSPAVATIRKALNNPEILANTYYTPGGDVDATFLIGKLLGPRAFALSLQRLADLSWRQLADNNVIFVGSPVFFDQLKHLPVQLDFSVGNSDREFGVTLNLHPYPGEPSRFVDALREVDAITGASQRMDREATTDDGEDYATITRVPGPLGTNEIVSFTAFRTPARLGAVQWFTNATYARTLVRSIANSSGEIPRYYQIVLKVKYKDNVPTEMSLVAHHEIYPTAPLNKRSQ